MSADLEFTQGSVSYAQADTEPSPWWASEDMKPVIIPKGSERKSWELAANFNFTVEMAEMATIVNGEMVKDSNAIMRPVRTWQGGANDGNVDLLGWPRTEGYGLVSPAEMLDFAETIIALGSESDGPTPYLATLGSVRNGNRNFASVNLGDVTVTAPNGFTDETRGYLSISNSYDGTSPYVVSNRDIRIVCANTQAMVLGHVKWLMKDTKGSLRGNFIDGRALRLNHTKNIHDRMEQGIEAIAEHNAWKQAYEAYAAKLMETKMTNRQFEAMVKELVLCTKDPSPADVAKNDRKRGQLVGTWKTEAKDRTGLTAWSAMNAFTHMTSHLSLAKATVLAPTAMIEAQQGFDAKRNGQANTLLAGVNTYLTEHLLSV